MKRILGRVWAALVITGIICFFSVPSLAAGLPAASTSKPSHSGTTFIKITDGTGVKMVDTSKAPLILDKPGYRYEPAGTDKLVAIKDEVRIIADNVAINNAVIDGDLYVYGNNVRLFGLTVKGTVFIVSGQDVAMDYCKVVSGKVEILDAAETEETAFGKTQPPLEGETQLQPVFAENSGIDGEVAAAAGLTIPAAEPDGSQVDPGKSPSDPEKSSIDPVQSPTGPVKFPPGQGSTGAKTDKPIVAFLESVAIDDFNTKYVIANKNRMLPAGWKPKDLVSVNVPYRGRKEAKYMRREASDALSNLFAAAKKDGILLCGISGFRSYELQKSVYNKYTRQLGEKTADMVSAKAGSSEHQTGLAIDISSKSLNYALNNSFANTREGKWLAGNAVKYGFILRYPKGKETITGYLYEPWHFRYIGAELATDMTKKGMTLEEYYGIVPKDIGQNLIAGITGNKVVN